MKTKIIETAVALTLASAAAADNTQRNKQVVRSLYEDAINGHRPELYAELVAADFSAGPGAARGPAALRSTVDELRAGFPDVHFTVEDLVAEGDRVAVRWSWQATHTGTFRKLAPSGRRVTNTGMAIYLLEGGKVRQVWLLTDRLGVLQQVGAVPE
jgi:predicted ester cyclase